MLKFHYVVIQRLRYRMIEASVLLGCLGLVELLCAIAGARLGGLLGLTKGWLLALCVVAIILIPALVRARRRALASVGAYPSKSNASYSESWREVAVTTCEASTACEKI